MVVGCMLGLILDNLIPGTAEERGLTYLQKVDGVENDEQVQNLLLKFMTCRLAFVA